jgi:SET domain-containing protein
MNKRRRVKPMFSSAPVEFRNSSIAGRGVFARRRFDPGDVVVPYAPKQRKVDVDDPEAAAAAETRLTLLSEQWSVIIPDTSVPGGWLCNHSCNPNSAIFSDGEGRIQCTRTIAPGEEVTIFYGWVTQNDRERDPCHCGSARCRGFINFDISDQEAAELDDDTATAAAFRRRLDEYCEFLQAIRQEQVEETIATALAKMRSRNL